MLGAKGANITSNITSKQLLVLKKKGKAVP